MSSEPNLAVTRSLSTTPSEVVSPERDRAAQLWQATQVPPEEVARHRAEMDKADRAVLELRRQANAARTEAEAVKARLEQVESERYPARAVWGLGVVAALATAAWVYERRKNLAAAHPELESSLFPVPATPAAFPPAVEPVMTDSEFEPSDMRVAGDEADQWIERAKVAVPKPN